jgi:hypothetical protein
MVDKWPNHAAANRSGEIVDLRARLALELPIDEELRVRRGSGDI